MGIVKPTPIQALSIDAVLDGKDVIAKAETGTGKTLAFGAPMMERIDAQRRTVLGLVVCPTRELAQQVANVLIALGKVNGVKVALIVGGDPAQPQVKQLKAGAQVVVGTPGRILDLYEQKFLAFPWAEFVVLDEADKMFEIGFLPDVRKILSFMPKERQTLLFSATYPNEVLELAREFTNDPLEVATASGHATVDSIRQEWISVKDQDRADALRALLDTSHDDDVFLVFCERRTDVDRLMSRMLRSRHHVRALHGGYDQSQRFKVMSAFRTGEVKALIATDVAARGLDVEHITTVVNYSVPREVEEYTHRIGRTGRAGRKGTAITFVMPSERRRWNSILERTHWDIQEIEVPTSRRRGGGRDSHSGSGRGRRTPAGRRGRSGGGRRPRRHQSK